MLHPSGEWLESFWANDVPVQPALRPGRDLRRRAGADQRLRRSRSTTPSSGASRWPARRSRSPTDARARTSRPSWARTPTRCSPSGSRANANRGRDRSGAEHRWPLEGVKVVDAGAFLAGPLGPMLLTDLGADVVKVEPPGGEGMRWVEWSFFGCQRGKRGVALDLKSPATRARARRAARAVPTSSTTTCACPRRDASALDEAIGAGRQPRHRLLPRQLVRPARAARRLARLRPALPVVVRLGGRGRGRGQPADVAPPRLHGPPVRDGLADLDACSRCTTATAPARRSSSPGRCSARRRDDRAARRTSTPTARSCPSRCSTTSRPASRPGTASPPVTDGWIAIAATTDEQLAALARSRASTPSTTPPTRSARERRRPRRARRRRRAERAGAARPGRAVLRAPPTTTPPGLDRPLRPRRLRRTSSSPGAFWIFGDLDVKLDRAPPDSASTPSRCSPRSASTPRPIDALVASGAAHAWKAGPHDRPPPDATDRCRRSPSPTRSRSSSGTASPRASCGSSAASRAGTTSTTRRCCAATASPTTWPASRCRVGPRSTPGRSRCSRSTRSTSTASPTSWRRSSSTRSRA